jgi:hypothetical protein
MVFEKLTFIIIKLAKNTTFLFENRYDFILDKIVETEQIKPLFQCSLSTDYCVCTHVSQLIDVISVLIVQTKNSDKKF